MLDKEFLRELEQFIHLHKDSLVLKCSTPEYMESKLLDMSPVDIEDFIEKHRQPTLREVLFKYIDEKELADADVYKKAGIDRKHFSKIRSKNNYTPKKPTLIALALALELSMEETETLLGSAGYSLSDSDTFDLVIQFFLEKKQYNIQEVNEALDYFSLKPLSS